MILDIGVIIEQEKSRLNSLDFIDSGIEEVNQDYLIPVYNVRSLKKNIIYRYVVPLNIDNGIYYKSEDVVLILIEDDKYFILGKLPWLYSQRVSVYNEDFGSRKIRNGRGFIELLPNGSFMFSFPYGDYNARFKIGGFQDNNKDLVLLGLSIDDRGEVFKITEDGIVIGDLPEIEIIGDYHNFRGKSFIFRAFNDDTGAIVYEVDDLFRIQLKDETFLSIQDKEYKIGIKENKIVFNEQIYQLSFEDDKFIVLSNGQNELFKIAFKDGVVVEIDNKNGKFSINMKDKLYVIVSEDKVVIKSNGDAEPVALAESLKEELDELRNKLNDFIQNVFLKHIHTSLAGPTGTPQDVSQQPIIVPPLPLFTNEWFSKKLEVE